MDWYSILLVAAFSVVIFGVFQGIGENRNIIVFRNYDDLGLTFLIPASFTLILLLFNLMKADTVYGVALGGLVSLGLFGLLAHNTYFDNDQNIRKTILALITKLPLSIVWILSLVQVINPSGKTSSQRQQSRALNLIILAVITPVIGLLVVDKSGQYFNPKAWLRGRRVGSGIRDYL